MNSGRPLSSSLAKFVKYLARKIVTEAPVTAWVIEPRYYMFAYQVFHEKPESPVVP